MGKDPLRHVVHRRVHLERSQVQGRKHLGLLEKHQDYVLRARDFHKKEKTLEKLREKTLVRNPDEFYFKMISSKLDEQGRFQTMAKPETRKEKQTQLSKNKAIVSLKHSIEFQALQKAKTRLHHAKNDQVGSHVFFYDTDDDHSKAEKNEPLVQDIQRHHTSPDTSLLHDSAQIAIQLAKRQSKTRHIRHKTITQATEQALQLLQSVHHEYSRIDQTARKAEQLRKAQDMLQTRYHLENSNSVRKVKGSDGVRNLYKWRFARLK